MNADTLNDPGLRARIDTPDFMETLSADAAGTFTQDVHSYLEGWQSRIKGWQDAGVSSSEFADLNRLSGSISTAGRVIEFFAQLRKLPPQQ